MKMVKRILCSLFLIYSSMAVSQTMTDEPSLAALKEKITITQGIAGQVMFWRGDFMPMMGDEAASAGRMTLVSREMYIYPGLKQDEVQAKADVGMPFYSKIKQKPIKTIQSDENGFFQAALPPGIYSILVREGKDFYANGIGANGMIYPIEVKANEVTIFQFDITYQATY